METNPTPPITTGRSASWQLTILAVIAIITAVTYLGPILKPFLSAVFVYFLIRPAADWMKRRGLPGALAWGTLFTLAVAALALLIAVVVSNAQSLSENWPDYRERLAVAVDRWNLGDRIRSRELSSEMVLGYLVQPTILAVEFCLMTSFYLLFIMLTAAKFPHRVRRAYPEERANEILRILEQVTQGMQRYMEVKTLINFGLAVSTGLIMFIFGIDYWPLWAALMFALNYVTYIGSVVALIPPILLALLKLPLVETVILTSILVGIRFLFIDYIEVRLSGKMLNIDSTLLLLMMAYWGWVWGLIGLVLAVPVITCIKMGLAAAEPTRSIATLMNED